MRAYWSILVSLVFCYYFFFLFFNDPATTEIYTLSLHDALPISGRGRRGAVAGRGEDLRPGDGGRADHRRTDRKSTRLNSSHTVISYAVFCLKKKKKTDTKKETEIKHSRTKTKTQPINNAEQRKT